jgi:hypothetical protein
MAQKDQAALRAVDEENPDEEVDIDLDAIDESLRSEAIGKPTTVKIDGKVIHVQHAGDWSATAMRAMTAGDFENWAREVIDDDKELGVWLDADLRNYQMEAVVMQCARASRLGLGKSRKRSGSSRNSRRR